MKPIKATLLYILKDDNILLVYKKRGHGEGRWNGIGGKIEGESPVQCAIREAREEAGVDVKNVELCGIIYFSNVFGRDWDVFVFRAFDFEGEPAESEEVLPEWFNINEIPYDTMWEDDREWLPVVIRGDYFVGRYDFDGDKLVKSELLIVSKNSLNLEFAKALKETL